MTRNTLCFTQEPTSQNPLSYSKLNRIDAAMEVDTEATMPVISEQTYNSMFATISAPRLETSTARLQTYTGIEISLQGKNTVDVSYKSQSKKLGLLVVPGS